MESRDSLGKNSIHFASSSGNSKIVNLLASLKPDIIFSSDNSGLSGLHYAVWNVSGR